MKSGIGWFFKTLFILMLSGTIMATAVVGAIFWHFSQGLPKIISVADYRPLGVTRILGGDGKEEQVLGEFFKERRYLVPFDKIPSVVVRAFVSAEDDRFFEHQGINLASILRASIANFKAGHVVQGGSTITQQVAKSLLLTPERSFVRKIKEVILASRIEKNLAKQQILYLYLNQIYLGHGAYGVESASRTYFHKEVSALTLSEAAILAGLPQAPSKYSPLLNPKRAKERQLYVLRRMYENKYITQTQMQEAATQPLKIYHDEDLNSKYAPYFVEHVRKYLVEKYGEKHVYEDGLIVFVPVTKQLSLVATNSLREGLRSIDKRIGFRGPIQHLKDSAEVEEFLKDARLKLIEKKIPYQLLLPDGSMDPLASMKDGGVQSESQLLDVGAVYQGVVTSLSERKKTAGILIGAIKTELLTDKIHWAESATRKVLIPGDVVLVKVIKRVDSTFQVSLEQDPIVQGALFSIDAQTGTVLAMVGGYDFDQSEFNRVTQAQRQPGSAFKPVVYSAALEKGFTPASIIVDSPIIYSDNGSGKWKPSNYDEKFYGDTTFRQALIKSRNIPTVKIIQSIQVPYLIEYAKRLGMNAKFAPDLTLALGSATISLFELTRVYALFSRLGRRVNPVFISKVLDRDGRVLEEHQPQSWQVSPVQASPLPVQSPMGAPSPLYPPPNDPDQVLDPRVASVMTHLMKEVVNYGTGHAAKNLGRAAAGKTGTTSDYVDAWFMGFTPNIVTGVWVGFDNQKSIGPAETGARAALPIWLNFMKEVVKNYPDSDFIIPPGVVFATIDPQTGKLAAPNASNAIKEAFIEGTQPTETADQAATTAPSQTQFFKEDTE